MGHISEKARVGIKAVVPDTAIIHDDVVVEDGAILHDYVVLYPGTVIRKGVEVYDHCVVGKHPTSPGSTARVYDPEYGQTIVGEDSILCPGVILYTGTVIGHMFR